ncbi:assembly factor cbp4 [Lambiella insularis]|nr:assembly factor cbp4 [Lambiella insularis]
MSARLWLKLASVGVVFCVGGPALIYYVTPTEEELFKRYNPELQKRSLENRQKKQEDFDHFVGKLKEYSKSNKPIWDVAAEDEARTRVSGIEEQQRIADEIQKRRDEIKRHSLSSN